MLSQVFNRSTAIRRNSFGYRPTRLFATCSAFPCKVCLIRLSQVKGSVHKMKRLGCRLRLSIQPLYSEIVAGDAPVAQLDRASAFEAEGREFESLRARQIFPVQ